MKKIVHVISGYIAALGFIGLMCTAENVFIQPLVTLAALALCLGGWTLHELTTNHYNNGYNEETR